MLNDKIKQHLQNRVGSNPSPELVANIKQFLRDNHDRFVSIVEIRDHYKKKSHSYYNAVYYLAIQGEIGFVDREYHLFSQHNVLKEVAKRHRTICWDKSFDRQVQSVPIRPKYRTNEDMVKILTGYSIKKITDKDLSELIKKAQKEQMERRLELRYAGSLAHITDPIKEVLEKYNVADPVALVHASDATTFLTMTETPAMPIKITIKDKSLPVTQTIECEHITIHSPPVISTIKEAFDRVTK